MKLFLKRAQYIGVYLTAFLLCGTAGLSSYAQSADAPETLGKWNRLPANGVFPKMEGRSKLSGPAVKLVDQALIKQLKAFESVKALHPPVGFEVDVNTSVAALQPKIGDKRYQPVLWLNFKHFNANKSGVLKPVGEGAAHIHLFANTKSFMTQRAGFFQDNEKMNLPPFFQKIPVTDSTADYTEYNFKTYPFPHSGLYRDFAIRVIRRNDRPIFIPFTRKEYVQYLISRERVSFKDKENQILDFKKQISQSRQNLKAPEFKNAQKAIEDGIKATENIIIDVQAKITDLRERLSKYEDLLSKMSTVEAHAIAFVDVETTRYSKNDLRYLVPYGRQEGWPLYKVNPDYYDPNLSPTVIQSIMVTYWYHGQLCPPWLADRCREVFEQIDYHLLKENMR